ncbi:15-hydroxyprostaglandin dehydrogenase [NAD(+)] [Paramyrothecium foliicola]|nr:15-hydroxyprostaglandin dehydrogenase [NAD(+)] [Paramyrothecium foliicola]
MASSSKVAIITGGASGMGFAVAENLAAQGWKVNILDFNAAAGEAATKKNPELEFFLVDVMAWNSLASSFDSVFKKFGRLDLVFANAGIIQMQSFYERQEELPPPELHQTSIDINLKAVINTAYLAQHYLRAKNNATEDPMLILTASIAGFVRITYAIDILNTRTYIIWQYAQEFNPLYSASKAGVVNFVRSIARPFYQDGIRTYAICPGTVRTNLLSNNVWDTFPEEYLTPMKTIVSTIDTLVAGGPLIDATGRKILKEADYGLAVEIFGENFYVRDQMEFINDGMRIICEAASLDNQQPNLLL